jgi:hypothetical protein
MMHGLTNLKIHKMNYCQRHKAANAVLVGVVKGCCRATVAVI